MIPYIVICIAFYIVWYCSWVVCLWRILFQWHFHKTWDSMLNNMLTVHYVTKRLYFISISSSSPNNEGLVIACIEWLNINYHHKSHCVSNTLIYEANIQCTRRNMHTVFALLCFVVVIHWLIFPYPSGLLRWHCGNLTIAPVPAKQPRWLWINTSCKFIMNDCIATTKQNTTKPFAYFLGYTVGPNLH